MSPPDTIAAIATAPGRAGVGIVRVSGTRVAEVAKRLVAAELQPRRATLVNIYDEYQSVIDKGLALFFAAPHSYTGEDVLELQGHGGPVVLQLILRRCLDLGARLAEPGEFTRRAYLNDKLDLAQAESVIDLIDASTERAARCAVRSLEGEFSERIEALAQSLTELRMLVEATLDFPEEEVDAMDRADAAKRLNVLLAHLTGIERASKQGSLLREGLHIVLAGQPNVGKSSLLNRLAGQELAIVTEIPGTTRDSIRQSITLEGVPAHIIDTAGLRESLDPIEQLGVARSWGAIDKADILLIVMDARTGETEADRKILERMPSAIPQVRVLNKIDLTCNPTARSEATNQFPSVWLSAKTGDGIELLRQALLRAGGWEGTHDGLFMARERHIRALAATQAYLEGAKQAAERPDLMAEELRLAHRELGAITGQVTADELLGEIFAHFCIGK